MNHDRSGVFVSKIPHHTSADHPDFVNDFDKRLTAIIQEYHDTAFMEQARTDRQDIDILTNIHTAWEGGLKFEVCGTSPQYIAYYDYTIKQGCPYLQTVQHDIPAYPTMLALVSDALFKSGYRQSATTSDCYIGENYIVFRTDTIVMDDPISGCHLVSNYGRSMSGVNSAIARPKSVSIFNRKGGFAELFANDPFIIEIRLSFHLILNRIIPSRAQRRIPLGRPFRSRRLPAIADTTLRACRAASAVPSELCSAEPVPPKAYNHIRVEESCAICFEAPSTVVYTPCGHCVVCAICDRAGEIRICPVCRVDINDRVLFLRDRESQVAVADLSSDCVRDEVVQGEKESVACSAIPGAIAN